MIRQHLARRMRAACMSYDFAVAMVGYIAADYLGARERRDKACDRYDRWVALTTRKASNKS